MHYQFSIPDTTLVEDALSELETLGLHSLYTIEEETITIGGLGTLRCLPKLSQLKYEESETIDWHSQWQSFAPNFDGQHAHFKVGNQTVKLLPGPGFGDLSHPTTQLMAIAMQEISLGDTILDIGSGSGVLDCIALHCNVKRFYIVDIDPQALTHSKQNMQLNAPNINPIYSQTIDPTWTDIDTILMNMILPDQESVFASYPFLKNFKGTFLCSGLLSHQVDHYQPHATIYQTWEKDGWLAIQFSFS